MKKVDFSINVNSPLDSEYVQKLSFKAGYKWSISGEIMYTNEPKLNFRGKNIEYSGRDFMPEGVKITYSFPEDALAIQKLFNTPEYKEGDYVVLGDNLRSRWMMDLGRVKESVQRIKSISKEEVIFKEMESWGFPLNSIARHATEDEIKAYKEGGDIYIGEHKVEFFDNNIKVGCASFWLDEVKAFNTIFQEARRTGYSFNITNESIKVHESKLTLPLVVTEKTLNKIIKKAGIK